MGGKVIFSNITGSYVLDSNARVIDKAKNEDSLIKKYKKLIQPTEKERFNILLQFKDKKYFPEFYNANLELTKKMIKDAFTDDLFVIQAINNIQEIDKAANLLVKRLREWYGYYYPEQVEETESHEKFVRLVLAAGKKKSEMGADLKKEDIEPMAALAKEIDSLYALRSEQTNYLKKIMEKIAPNLNAVAGSLIGAKLIEHAGGLKRLAMMPASTVQLLGAEKALFRHMKTGARSPKYGLILNHPIVSGAGKEKGKAARALADKISIAVKVDFYKGKFMGDKLNEELKKRWKS